MTFAIFGYQRASVQENKVKTAFSCLEIVSIATLPDNIFSNRENQQTSSKELVQKNR